jgi:hypothetical protein
MSQALRNISLLILAALVLTACAGWAQSPSTSLSAEQIAEQLRSHNQARNDALRHYTAVRHYLVEYRGFSAKLEARMEVEASYDAKTGKSFRVLSESGSKALCDKVLRRALESEIEATHEKTATAMTTANYRFRLVGDEKLDGRTAYILDVEPLTASKFLVRGKIWVDATDFAVVKMEAEPSKNPSFWISRTLIRQSFAKTGEFWLAAKNRSETKVRFGGTAVLLIDYGNYQIVSNADGLNEREK